LSRSPPRDFPKIPELTLIDFISGLGSVAPAPGAGAAGAIALSLGAACAAKAFAISGRHTGERALNDAAERARAIAAIALEGAQRDATDFRAWLKSHDPGNDAALKTDASILFAVASELVTLIADKRPLTIPSLSADLDAALRLVQACVDIERQNLAEL
jgi:formiminotetrahydrofolate cyclodeaminase